MNKKSILRTFLSISIGFLLLVGLFSGVGSATTVNHTWEKIELYNVSNRCSDCVVSYTGTYNNSDRWIDPSTLLVLPYMNLSSTVVRINLTGNQSIIGKAVNSSGVYSSGSNSTTTFIAYHGYIVGGFQDSNIVPPTNVIYESLWSASSTTANMGNGLQSVDGTRYTSIQNYAQFNQLNTYTTNNGSTTFVTTAKTLAAGSHTSKIISLPSIVRYYVDGIEIGTGTTTNIPFSNMGLYAWQAVGTHTQTYAFARKYTATEPSLTYNSTINNYESINITSWGNNYTNDNSLSITILKGNTVKFNVTTNVNITGMSYGTGTGTYVSNSFSGTSASLNVTYNNVGSTTSYINVTNSTSGTYNIKTWNVNVVAPIDITQQWNNFTNSNVTSFGGVVSGTIIKLNVTTNIIVDSIPDYWCAGNPALGSGYSGTDAYIVCKIDNLMPAGGPYITVSNTSTGTTDTVGWNILLNINITSWGNNYTTYSGLGSSGSQILNYSVLNGTTVRFNVTTDTNTTVNYSTVYPGNGNFIGGLGVGYGGGGTRDLWMIINFPTTSIGNPYINVSDVYSWDKKTWNITASCRDDFNCAEVILPSGLSGGYTNFINTKIATTAADDPNVGIPSYGRGHSVWYNFTPSVNMKIFANTYGGSSSDFDTVLSVFTGNRGSLVLVVANDDCSGHGLQSCVEFNVVAGTKYSFMLGSYGSGAGGNLTLNLYTTTTIESWQNDYTLDTTLNFTANIAPPPTGTDIVFNVTAISVITNYSYDCDGAEFGLFAISPSLKGASLLCFYDTPGSYTSFINVSINNGLTFESKTWNITTQYSVPSSGLSYNRIDHTLTYTAGNNPQTLFNKIYVNGTKVNEVYDITTQYYNVYPEADTYIDSQFPSTNYGNNLLLKVIRNREFFSANLWGYTLLRFGWTAIPWDEYVTEATLSLYLNGTNSDFKMDLHNITNRTWTENGVTWNTFNASFDPVSFASFQPGITTPGILSNYIKSQFNANKNADFLIKPSVMSPFGSYNQEYRNYDSKEVTNVSRRPYLNVTTIAGFKPPISGKTYTVNLGSYLPLTNNGTKKDVSIRIDEINLYNMVISSTYLNVTSVASPSSYDRFGYSSAAVLREDINKDGLSIGDMDKFNRVCQEQKFNLRFGNIGESFTIRDSDTGEILYNYVGSVPGEYLIDYTQQIGRPTLARFGKNKVFIGAEGVAFNGNATYKNNETYRVIDGNSGFLIGQTLFDSVNITCIANNRYTSGAAFVEDSYTFGQDVNITWAGDSVYSPVSNITVWAKSTNESSDSLYLLKNFTLDGSVNNGNFKAFSTSDAQIQTLYNKKLIENGLFHVSTNRLISGEWMSDGISNFNIVFPVEKRSYKGLVTLEDLKSGFGFDIIALFLMSLILMFLTVWILGKHFEDSGIDTGHNTTIVLVIVGVEAFVFMMLGWIPIEVIIIMGILIALYFIEKVGSKGNNNQGAKGGF